MLHKRSSGSVEITSVDRGELLAELRRVVALLAAENPEVERVELFGSFVRGDFTPSSDVDLVIVVRATETPFLARADVYRHFFAHFPFDVHLLVYTRDEAERLGAEPGFLRRALCDSLPLLDAAA